MQDKLDEIYKLLIKNETIKKYTHYIDDKQDAYRISFYVEPETGDLDQPFIIIAPIGPPVDKVYGSDQPLNTQFIYQIDVQSKKRLICKEIQREVKEELQKFDFYQQENGFDDYFRETGRFVDARRYRGQSKLYDTDY